MRFGLSLLQKPEDETVVLTIPAGSLVARLLNTTCTLKRRSASASTDDYGNAVQNVTLVSTPCSLQQTNRDEPHGTQAQPGVGGEVSVTLWSLYLPTGTALDTGDEVVVNNAEYEVVGAPWDAIEGNAAVHHVEATVRKIAGAEDLS